MRAMSRPFAWLRATFRSLFRRGRLNEELDEEFRDHLERQIEEGRRAGLPPEEARYAALRAMGAVTRSKEECRDLHSVWIDNLLWDFRCAGRALGRNPGFATLAVLIVALGIGSTTAVFSVFHSVVLKPPPYEDPARLVAIWEGHIEEAALAKVFAQPDDFEHWKAHSRSFDRLAAVTWALTDQVLTGRGPARRVRVIPGSADLFSLLGVSSEIGRTFEPGDEDLGCAVVVSHAFWRDALEGDRNAVGGSIDLDSRVCTVMGVMPSAFEFFPPATEVWALYADSPFAGGAGVFGRLRNGVTRDSAEAELRALHEQLHEGEAHGRDFVPGVYPIQEEFTWLAGRNLGSSLWVLLAAVTAVLLIACLNVANLFLGRALARGREFSVRAALGSGRSRIVRQLLTEGLLISALAAAAGVLSACGAVHYFRIARPVALPPGVEPAINGPVLALAAGLCVMTVLVFALAPAVGASRIDLGDAMKMAAGNTPGSPGARRAGAALVIGEVMLSVALLIVAGLIIQSVWGMANVHPGYDPNGLWMMTVRLPDYRYASAAQRMQFYREADRQSRSVPGVGSTAWARFLPRNQSLGTLLVEGRPERPPGAAIPDVVGDSVTADYFRVMSIPVYRGRAFGAADTGDSRPVAIVNQALADRYFPGADPIGRYVRYPASDPEAPWLEIVGVAGNEKEIFNFDEMTWVERPFLFRPFSQAVPSEAGLLVRFDGNPADVISEVRSRIARVDPDVPVTDPAVFSERVRQNLSYPRFRAALLAGFAAAALCLALTGLYSVLSQQVARRTRELGVRIAVGARHRQVLWLVMRQAAVLSAAGILCGLAAAWAVARYLEAMLFGVTPLEPATFVVVPAAFAAVAALAAWVPARRATRVDPMAALRQE